MYRGSCRGILSDSVVASFPGSCAHAREPGNEANSVGAASELEYTNETQPRQLYTVTLKQASSLIKLM